jgi:hypothetical protein
MREAGFVSVSGYSCTAPHGWESRDKKMIPADDFLS